MSSLPPINPTLSKQAFWPPLLWLLLSTLGLLLLSEGLRLSPCLLLPVLIAVLAYPLWFGLHESFLFKRRLILRGATPDDAAARRLFWNGYLGAALLVVPALVFSALLLVLSASLTAAQWAVLGADALLVGLLYALFRRQIASQVHGDMLGVVVRSWPLWLSNLLLLSGAFVALSFFQGVPDVRHEHWSTIAEQAFVAQQSALPCPLAGWLSGLMAAVDQGSWALAQRYIPSLPGWEWRLAAWLLFLSQLGLLAFLFSRLLLGVLTLVDQQGLSTEAITGRSLASKTFIMTILVLALPVLYAGLKWRDLDPSQFADVSTSEALLARLDPCREQPGQSAEVQAALSQQITSAQREAEQRLDQRIERELDLLFAPVEARVDDFLDWYFTVVGEYERLAALIAGDILVQMRKQIETHLLAGQDLDAQLMQFDQVLLDETIAQATQLTTGAKAHLLAETKANPCHVQGLDLQHLANLDRDLMRASAALSSGTVAGATAVITSKKLAASLSAKIAAKKSLQAAAATAGKAFAKKGASAATAAAGGTLACAPSGPLAVLCGIGTGITAWFAVDKAAIEIEEAVSREAMRADILAALEEEKQALKMALQHRHRASLRQLTAQVQETIDGVFIPMRDGL